MRPAHFRLLFAIQAFGCLLLLWWLWRPEPVDPGTTPVSSGNGQRVPASTSSTRSALSERLPAEPAAEGTSSRAADETRALIFGAAQSALEARVVPEALNAPTPPTGGALPLIFGRVPDHVDLGEVGTVRLRQLQEGFLRSVSPRAGESPAAYRQRWDRAVRLADAQLWPVFGQEVANAFANARQLGH